MRRREDVRCKMRTRENVKMRRCETVRCENEKMRK